MLTVPGRRIRRTTFLIATSAIVLPAAGQTWQVPKPSLGLMPNPAVGEQLFAQNCASCHGVDLKGTKQGPPLLHPFYVSSHHSDAAFQIAAKYGVRAHHWQFGDMKPLPGVSADDVAHITAFVRWQQRLAGIE